MSNSLVIWHGLARNVGAIQSGVLVVPLEECQVLLVGYICPWMLNFLGSVDRCVIWELEEKVTWLD